MNINSLHIKLSLAVATAALLVAIVSSAVFYQRGYTQSYADSERSVMQLLETVRTTAAISAYVGNTELAQQVVSGLDNNDIVVGAHIRANDQIIGSSGTPLRDTDPALVSIQLTAPFDETDVVGQLSVLPNLPLIAERAKAAAELTTLGLLIQALVITLVVLIMVYGMITKPLSRLSTRLHQITPGDGKRLYGRDFKRSDELGLLVGDVNGLLITVDTILEDERQLRRRVEQLEHRFRGIFEDSSAGIFLVHATHGSLVTANPAFFKLTGLDPAKEEELAASNIITRIFAEPSQAQSVMDWAIIRQNASSADLRLARQDGLFWTHCIFSPANGNNPQEHIIEGVMYDVTQRKQEEERTRELAETDSLTGLVNRQAAEAQLDAQIDEAAPSHSRFAIMLIDLDRFKEINDTYGHDAGDRVLISIAERLQRQVRDTDTVSRLGGDEFLMILPQANNKASVERIAQNILTALRDPIEVQKGIYETVGVSIGIALYPEHGDNELSIRKHADQAMYSVKRRGKNGFAIYEPAEHPTTEGSP